MGICQFKEHKWNMFDVRFQYNKLSLSLHSYYWYLEVGMYYGSFLTLLSTTSELIETFASLATLMIPHCWDLPSHAEVRCYPYMKSCYSSIPFSRLSKYQGLPPLTECQLSTWEQVDRVGNRSSKNFFHICKYLARLMKYSSLAFFYQRVL